MSHRSLLAAAFTAAALCAAPPRTAPEASAFQRTSTVAEVKAFMEALAQAHPELKPYRAPGAPDRAEGGTPLLAWRLPATSPDALRVYLNGNIHAGEVEGKEAIQLIFRELLEGQHPELRRHLDLVAVPAYNADGTDALDPQNRRWQFNPASGVGRRENARGLDLNRDVMKAEAASTRLFLAIAQAFDPQLVMDLHTTDGSTHGFHLTYSPASALGAYPALMALNRRLVTEVRERLKGEGMPTYDYGDFEPDEPGRKGAMPERWGTVHPLPRYLVNYQALRNRLGILSEAFVYRKYPERIQDTRRFVLACLEWAVTHREELRQREAAAEQGWKPAQARLPLAFEPVAAETYPFEVITPLRNEDRQVIGEKLRQTVPLPAFTAWEDRELVDLPTGYLVDPIYAEEVGAILTRHGIKTLPGTQRPAGFPVLHFQESGRTLGPDHFQGVMPLALQGAWKADAPTKPRILPWRPADLDRALWVPLDQPLGRLAFYLLDPRSPDGLVYWGSFHSVLVRGRMMWGEPPRFPILALGTAGGAGGPAVAPKEKQE